MREEIMAKLTGKDDRSACALADQIIAESRRTDKWYAYFDVFAALLDHPKSLVRNRAVHMLAANANGMTKIVLMRFSPAFSCISRMKSRLRPDSAFRRFLRQALQSRGIFRRYCPPCGRLMCQSTGAACVR